MEKKIASYTEANARLQLVKVDDHIELRLNRKVISVWPGSIYDHMDARLSFVSAVHNILIMRQSNLSYLTR